MVGKATWLEGTAGVAALPTGWRVHKYKPTTQCHSDSIPHQSRQGRLACLVHQLQDADLGSGRSKLPAGGLQECQRLLQPGGPPQAGTA